MCHSPHTISHNVLGTASHGGASTTKVLASEVVGKIILGLVSFQLILGGVKIVVVPTGMLFSRLSVAAHDRLF